MSKARTRTNKYRDLSRLLMTKGAVCFPSPVRDEGDPHAWEMLAKSWDSLEVDKYMINGEDYRQRRYGVMAVTPTADGYDLEPKEPEPFVQAADIMPLYGGQVREFAPMEESTLNNVFLWDLILDDLEVLRSVADIALPYFVGLHQIRVIAAEGTGSAPAPEGRHRDGHDFIAMHLIQRRNCSGGVSKVFEPRKELPFLEYTLTEPLDTLIVDDASVEHDVTPVVATGEPAIRDMLLVDFVCRI